MAWSMVTTVIANVISTQSADNPSSWDQIIAYLNFMYKTNFHYQNQEKHERSSIRKYLESTTKKN